MPDAKITALTAISVIDPAVDPLPIVDVSDTAMAASGTTKKITINQLLGASGTATLASATITGDLTVRTNRLFANVNGVGFGTTGIFADFQVQRSTNARLEIDSSSTGISYQVVDNARTGYLQNVTIASQHLWFNGLTEAMRLNSNGLGVGASPANDKILSLGSMGILLSGATSDFSFRNSGGTAIQRLRYTDATGTLTIGSATGTAYPVELGGNTTTRAVTIDASNNLILQSSATPATLTVNGQLTVNATSNTNLRFSYRGSDGTTRVANITLA
jgi:hypothetical protein